MSFAVPLENGIFGQDFRVVEEEDDLLKDSLEDHVFVAVLLYLDDKGVLGLGGRRQSGKKQTGRSMIRPRSDIDGYIN